MHSAFSVYTVIKLSSINFFNLFIVHMVEANIFTKVFWHSSQGHKHFSSGFKNYVFNSEISVVDKMRSEEKKNHVLFHRFSIWILLMKNYLRIGENPCAKSLKSLRSLALAASARKAGEKLFHWSLRLLNGLSEVGPDNPSKLLLSVLTVMQEAEHFNGSQLFIKNQTKRCQDKHW